MAIGETILAAVIQFILQQLISPYVIDFFRRSKIDQQTVNRLKTLMLSTEKLVLDAEEKSFNDQNVKQWLNELKHWLYRAEEVMDDIATKALQASLDSPSESPSCGIKVHNFLHSYHQSSYTKTTNQNLKEIVNMLDDMLSQKDALGLRELAPSAQQPQRMPKTSNLLEDSKVYGRDEDRERILEFLLSGEPEGNGIGAMAIVGMGGIGKTTLAKLIFNEGILKEAFDLKAWVCVTDQFDISRVTRSIIEEITCKPYLGDPELNLLQNELSGKLREKRFLLVLDDVWNENYGDWECLRAPLSVGAKGSKIIITTRNSEVASIISTTPQYIHLKSLSDDDGRSLLFQHAFGVEGSIVDHSIDRVGRKIVKKCGGLPLAIKTLGGLLRSTHDTSKWEAVLHDSLWELPKEKSKINPALWLSYYYLPAHLKRCFSYCAIFPKDYAIHGQELVHLWMAENFVLSSHGEKRIEDVGSGYVQELLNKSFLESLDKSRVKMHDLMHDLAQVVLGDFLTRHEPGSSINISERARHFSYSVDPYDAINKFQGIGEAHYMRTFLQYWRSSEKQHFISNTVISTLVSHVYYLRVLTLSNYEIFELPESLGCLNHLRYLDVSGTRIRELPTSVTSLSNLQTLLLHNCHHLERLPTKIMKLVSLRHLVISGTASLSEMPPQMSKLTNLQTLTDFVLGKNSRSNIRELRELQIRDGFTLRRLQNLHAPNDGFYANLSEKTCINVLALEFDHEENDDAEKEKQLRLLENLRPHTSIEELRIRNFEGRGFPKWLNLECSKYKKMTSLCLSGCSHCHSLPPLGHLPSLKQLELEKMNNIATVGVEFYGLDNSSAFPVLECLGFEKMESWELWSNMDDKGNVVAFPRLKKLSLHDCPRLKGCLSFHTPHLEKVEIDRCDQLEGLISQEPSKHIVQVASCPYGDLVCAFNVTSITRLELVGLGKLLSLSPDCFRLPSLRDLTVKLCENLQSLSCVQLPSKLEALQIEECKSLESLPNNLPVLGHLDRIKLRRCQSLRSDPDNSLPTSLRYLWVGECEHWEFPIPIDRMHQFPSLEVVMLENTAPSLTRFPLGILPNLRSLYLERCLNLEKVCIAEGIATGSLRFLSHLYFKNCPKLEMVGKILGSGEATTLPADNLLWLRIWGCENLQMPVQIDTEEEVLLPKLNWLAFGNPGLTWTPWRNLFTFSNLKTLMIGGSDDVKCFPDPEGSVTLPTSLVQLYICEFRKLRELDGRALRSLTSLQRLGIAGCPELESLPKDGLPPSLGLLSIKDCPKLEGRCRRKKGREWSIIKHLPCVLINRLYFVPDTHGKSVQWNGPIIPLLR